MDIKSKIIDHCISIGMKPNPSNGYLSSISENLLFPFLNWSEIEKELVSGQGSELKIDSSGKIKFAAVHSSSALCVNNFAEFKLKLEHFSFLNYTNFIESSFEKKLPTGISTPNLDFYLETKYEIIGFESKFIETITAKLPNKGANLEKYQNRKQLEFLPNTFSQIIDFYIGVKNPLFLDVAQLIKHSIGIIKRSQTKYKFILNSITNQPVLVYIYWQPKNWYNFDIYRQHAQEIEQFKEKIEDHIIFIPISYPDFWKMYENDRLFANHISMVKKRYYFNI